LVDFDRAELDTCLIAKTNMGWLWHRRLAHVGMKNLHKLLQGEHILGLTNVHFEKDRICSACQAGKQVGVHHPHKNIMTTDRPLELLHMDLFGPIAYISIGGSKYCLVIVDDYSCFTWVFFLQEKSQTQETLKGFLRRAQNEFGLRIKKIRSDNGTEFKNSQIEGFLLGYGSNTRAYRVFNKSSGLVEVSCDVVFDETNGSQVEQVDLDEIGGEEAPCIALRNMSIGNVCPKESEEPPNAQDQPSSSTQASPTTPNEDEAQVDEG
jgi:hypothetical protein